MDTGALTVLRMNKLRFSRAKQLTEGHRAAGPGQELRLPEPSRTYISLVSLYSVCFSSNFLCVFKVEGGGWEGTKCLFFAQSEASLHRISPVLGTTGSKIWARALDDSDVPRPSS